VDGRLVWEPTKTYARRTVRLPRFLCEQLAAHLAERPHGPDDLVFIAQGASVKAVQAQLGHASATVTLDRCGHLFPDELQQLADRLQDAYAEAVTDPARTEGPETMLREGKGAGR
jgi:integrase